ncbi:protein of unknown function [Acidithiobacillus ferrivorans]|uniref:Uncharacterized protein n=1 Tax=Acidithiobacillus ferrivorans TaxID=160808 RepID=A0A060UVU5_9PROT|nr:hypothetical protein AFERRI_420196 [Acidithiobacillus ferrivorans]SMH66036.1 protein of unknown function [Acidithiobacillus ferrivorans]
MPNKRHPSALRTNYQFLSDRLRCTPSITGRPKLSEAIVFGSSNFGNLGTGIRMTGDREVGRVVRSG